MCDQIGWIVQAKIIDGKRNEFEAVMHEIVAATEKENGTLNYQYYVQMMEMFSCMNALKVLNRLISISQTGITMLNVGLPPLRRLVWCTWVTCPIELCERHAALAPKLLKPFGGFAR